MVRNNQRPYTSNVSFSRDGDPVVRCTPYAVRRTQYIIRCTLYIVQMHICDSKPATNFIPLYARFARFEKIRTYMRQSRYHGMMESRSNIKGYEHNCGRTMKLMIQLYCLLLFLCSPISIIQVTKYVIL